VRVEAVARCTRDLGTLSRKQVRLDVRETLGTLRSVARIESSSDAYN
jgi:hypothetical protein